MRLKAPLDQRRQRVGRVIDRQRGRVARGAGAEKRQHHVRTARHPPASQSLAKILIVLLELCGARHIEEPAQPQHRIDGDPHQVGGCLVDLALQQIVGAYPQIADIAEEVRHPVADDLRQYEGVAARDRLQHIGVERVVEFEHRTIDALQRIARIAAGGSAAAEENSGREGRTEPESHRLPSPLADPAGAAMPGGDGMAAAPPPPDAGAAGLAPPAGPPADAAPPAAPPAGPAPGPGADDPPPGEPPDLSMPPSAALLYRNWPMRFSRMTAPWVISRVSPSFRSAVSPPGVRPMYCSPSNPDVRICADVSLGKGYLALMVKVTTASNVCGSKLISVTRPSSTPAARTGARTLRAPILLKCPFTLYTAADDRLEALAARRAMKISAAMAARTNRPTQKSTARLRFIRSL